ncbi:hypothetical protein I317_07958 [Kwoniella heveanensis CBS 569]|nr:hypothetical protein I317_07958 [Kwoniella heveanensis CBS 569]
MTPEEYQTIYRAFGRTELSPRVDDTQDQGLAQSPARTQQPSSTQTDPNTHVIPLPPATELVPTARPPPLEPWGSPSARVDPEKARRVFNEVAERRIGQGEISRQELEMLLETGDQGIRHGKIAGYTSAALSALYLSTKWRRIGSLPTVLGIMGGSALGAVVVGLGSSVWSYEKHYAMIKDWDEDTIDRKWRILEEINAEAGERAKPSWQQRLRRPEA